jgi:hypothetical protein
LLSGKKYALAHNLFGLNSYFYILSFKSSTQFCIIVIIPFVVSNTWSFLKCRLCWCCWWWKGDDKIWRHGWERFSRKIENKEDVVRRLAVITSWLKSNRSSNKIANQKWIYILIICGMSCLESIDKNLLLLGAEQSASRAPSSEFSPSLVRV